MNQSNPVAFCSSLGRSCPTAVRAALRYSFLLGCVCFAWCLGLIGCATPPSPSSSVAQGKVYGSTETVRFGGLAFKTLSCEAASFSKSTNGLIVRVSYENTGRSALHEASRPRFTIVDERDNVYEEASSLALVGAPASLEIAQNQLAMLQPLNPGVVRESIIAFELPDSAKSGSLRLRVMCPNQAGAGYVWGPFFYYILPSPSPETRQRDQSVAPRAAIRNGMSRQDVYDLWGAPDHQVDNGAISAWFYNRDGSVWLRFESGILVNYSPPFTPEPR